ncbi:MAG: DUF1045 domain-containing protein [Rhodobacteraceae bacterium]|nr:DUF1045 domain-containing protein [Paracoccaceae bacterium]
MTTHTRFALYYTAPGSELAQRGAAWLGWDIANGHSIAPTAGPSDAVATPRKYGFHGTLKPPFRLAPDKEPAALAVAAREIANSFAAFDIPALQVTTLGSFFALTAEPNAPLAALAAACVTRTDDFRAPPTDAELERRRARRLTAPQETLLAKWGYPYVLEAFRFHLTLTGRTEKAEREHVLNQAKAHFAPCLAAPHPINAITLCGEREDGQFEELEVLPLKG